MVLLSFAACLVSSLLVPGALAAQARPQGSGETTTTSRPSRPSRARPPAPVVQRRFPGPAPGAPDLAAPAASAPLPPVDAQSTLAPYQDQVLVALAARPGGLTAHQVAVRAALSAPAIAQKRAEMRIAAAKIDRTLARYVPDVTATGSYIRQNRVDIDLSAGGDGGALLGARNEGPFTVGPCPMRANTECVVDSAGMPVGSFSFAPIQVPLNNFSLQASLSIPFTEYALRLLPAGRAAKQERRAARMQHDAQLLKVMLDARLAFYDWLRAVAQLAVTKQSRLSARAHVQDAKAGLSAGTLTQADVLRLEGLETNAQLAVNQAASLELLARQNLALIMEIEHTRFTVGEDVLGDVPGFTESREQLIALGKRRRPELAALAASAGAFHHAAEAAKADLYPRLSGVANLTHANPNQRFFPQTNEWNASWYVGLNLTWRLTPAIETHMLVRELRATEQSLGSQLAAMRRAIEMEVNATWQELERARVAARLSEQLSASAQAAYEQQVALYRAGEATTTAVIEAEVERMNATLLHVNARIDQRAAGAKLERATGRRQQPTSGRAAMPASARQTGLDETRN